MNTFVSYLPKLLVYFPRNYDDFCALCHDIIIPGDLSRLDLHAEAVAAASLLKGGGQAGRSGENIVGGGGGGWGGGGGRGRGRMWGGRGYHGEIIRVCMACPHFLGYHKSFLYTIQYILLTYFSRPDESLKKSQILLFMYNGSSCNYPFFGLILIHLLFHLYLLASHPALGTPRSRYIKKRSENEAQADV